MWSLCNALDSSRPCNCLKEATVQFPEKRQLYIVPVGLRSFADETNCRVERLARSDSNNLQAGSTNFGSRYSNISIFCARFSTGGLSALLIESSGLEATLSNYVLPNRTVYIVILDKVWRPTKKPPHVLETGQVRIDDMIYRC
jgi:hypothetical protein